MTGTIDRLHEDAVKMELIITSLSQKLKDSVRSGEDGRQLQSTITRQLDALKGKIDVSVLACQARLTGYCVAVTCQLAHHLVGPSMDPVLCSVGLKESLSWLCNLIK